MQLNTKQGRNYEETLREYFLETRVRNQNCIGEENMG